MNTDIDMTAEQLIKQSLDLYKSTPQPPDLLVANTIARLFPNKDGAMVRAACFENSVFHGLKKAERDAQSRYEDFKRCGQMSLFGELVPEHMIPKSMMDKSVDEVNKWMQHRADIENENAEEMLRAAKAAERKAAKYRQWATATQQVNDICERAGINPAEISYAEALKKAESTQPWDGPVSDAQAKRSMR